VCVREMGFASMLKVEGTAQTRGIICGQCRRFPMVDYFDTLVDRKFSRRYKAAALQGAHMRAAPSGACIQTIRGAVTYCIKWEYLLLLSLSAWSSLPVVRCVILRFDAGMAVVCAGM
jgi:hypothetical protein